MYEGRLVKGSKRDSRTLKQAAEEEGGTRVGGSQEIIKSILCIFMVNKVQPGQEESLGVEASSQGGPQIPGASRGRRWVRSSWGSQ